MSELTVNQECTCCHDCDHLVQQITQRGVMPDTVDGREVRKLIARNVSPCDNCNREWLTDGTKSKREDQE